jgi:TrmH family RNA methyltransferase
MNLITSRSNPKIKQARSLRQRKYRQSTGLFLVEGIRPVGEAVEAIRTGWRVEAIYYAPELLDSDFALQLIKKQSDRGIPCYATSVGVFRSITTKENPQGILAIVQIPTLGLNQLSPEYFTWGIALVAPQDPGNVGAILRTIDAVGASGLILLGESTDPYHPNSVRASMGAIFRQPVIQASFDQFSRWAVKNKYHIYGTSAHGDMDARLVTTYYKPAILLLGSERTGLTPAQTAICGHVLRLPMRGAGTSLNLAVATGVMLYGMLDKFSPLPE